MDRPQPKIIKQLKDYRDEIKRIRETSDALHQITDANRLVETLLKRHFSDGASAKTAIGALVNERKGFLGSPLFQEATKAISIRHQVAHGGDLPMPNDERKREAAEVLLKVAEVHIEELRRKSGQPKSKKTTKKTQASTGKPVNRLPATAQTKTPKVVAAPSPVVTELSPISTDRADELKASPEHPWISASDVAEHRFCRRAGVLTNEGRYEERPTRISVLGLMPRYEIAAIEEEYRKRMIGLILVICAFPIVVTVMNISPIGPTRLFPIGVLLILAVCIYVFSLLFLDFRELGYRKLLAETTEPLELDVGRESRQPVNWWSLLRAGYEVSDPTKNEAYKDGTWRLSGKPYRLLRKGMQVIPVHRINSIEISDQHIVRMMALSLVVELTSQASPSSGDRSPGGIILFGNSYDGEFIPCTQRNRELFYDSLIALRADLSQTEVEDDHPPIPKPNSCCLRCPHGRPRSVFREEKTMRGDKVLPPRIVERGRRKFHCPCGDRFGWTPPHEQMQGMTRTESPLQSS